MAKTNQGAPAQAEKTEKPLPPLRQTSIMEKFRGSRGPQLIETEERAPADVLEHFRKRQCNKGHSNWDEHSIIYNMDGKSWILMCLDCEEGANYYVLPAGGMVGMPDRGKVKDAKNKEGDK